METTLNGKKVFKIVIPAVIENYAQEPGESEKPVTCRPQRWLVTVGRHKDLEFRISIHWFKVISGRSIDKFVTVSTSTDWREELVMEGQVHFIIRSPDGGTLGQQSGGPFTFRADGPFGSCSPRLVQPTAEVAAKKGWLFDGDLHIAAEVFLQVDNITLPDRLSRIPAELRNSGKADFILASADGQDVPTRKLVLSICSPIFSAMFQDWKECRETKDGRYKFGDFEADSIKAMLDYIQGGPDVNRLGYGLLQDVYRISDCYQISFLNERCREMLMERTGLHDVIDMLLLADAHSDNQLKKAGFDLMLKNPYAVMVNGIDRELRSADRELHEEFLDYCSIEKLGQHRERVAD